MAAITAVYDAAVKFRGLAVERWHGTSTAHQADTLSSAVVGNGYVSRIVYVAIGYSAAPTYTGTALTVKIDSGLGSAFDFTLKAGSDNTQFTVYSPDEEVFLLPGDAVIVAAPDGGVGVTSNIVICTERV
jgi:hypothetical protein